MKNDINMLAHQIKKICSTVLLVLNGLGLSPTGPACPGQTLTGHVSLSLSPTGLSDSDSVLAGPAGPGQNLTGKISLSLSPTKRHLS